MGLSRLRDINAINNPRVKIFTNDIRMDISDGIVKEIANEITYIAHLAAETHVDKSILDPKLFVETNVLGTFNVLEFAKKCPNLKAFNYFSTDEVYGPAPDGILFKESDGLNCTNPYSASKAGGQELASSFANTYNMPLFISNCHSEDTLCWSKNGFVSVDNLKVGDEVYTLNDKQEIELNKIDNIIQYDYIGDMINLEGNSYSQLVTPEHRVLTKKRYGEKQYTAKYAIDLLNIGRAERHYVPTSGKWSRGKRDSVNIKKSIRFCKFHYNSKDIPDTLNTYDLFEFLGWFISEGGSNDRGGFKISQRNARNKKNIIKCIERLGFSYGLNSDDIQMNSVKFCKFLKQFGRNSSEKQIPRWVLEYDVRYLERLFHSLMLGDGTRVRRGWRYYSKSKELCNQVAELSIKLGYSANVKSRKCLNPSKTCESIQYYTNICKSKSSLEKSNISIQKYRGKVWCLKVKNGNFFVQRNGKICCSGNCMNVFGERQHPEKFVIKCIAKILRGETIYIHANNDYQIGTRNYIHARNVAKAIEFLFTNFNVNERYNINGEKEVNNLDMLKFIAGIIGKEPKYEIVNFVEERPGHDFRYALDGSKMENMGWSIPMQFEQSLMKTVQWTLAHQE